MSWWTTLLSRGSPILVVAITMLPVLILMILSAPAWVVWPWLREERRESVHRMVDQLAQWTREVLFLTMPSHNAVMPNFSAKTLKRSRGSRRRRPPVRYAG
jgi:hypothetical protein